MCCTVWRLYVTIYLCKSLRLYISVIFVLVIWQNTDQICFISQKTDVDATLNELSQFWIIIINKKSNRHKHSASAAQTIVYWVGLCKLRIIDSCFR